MLLCLGEVLNKSTPVAVDGRQPDRELLPRGDGAPPGFQASAGRPQLPFGGAADPLQRKVQEPTRGAKQT